MVVTPNAAKSLGLKSFGELYAAGITGKVGGFQIIRLT